MTIAKLTSPVRSKSPLAAAATRKTERTSNRASRGFFKVVRMSAKQLYPVILLLVIGCQQSGIGANNPALLANNAAAEAGLDKQLKINKDTLLKGASEQIRIDAATIMLFSEDPLAREILISVLKQPENIAARVAVCKALSQTRGMKEPIRQKGDFIQPLLEILTTEDSAVAKLAAEATLIFEYEQISEPLEKLITDSSLPVKARLNAINALKLQPDMRAIFKLMELLDDPEKQVVEASEKALQSLGIPVSKDAKTRKQIRDELERKGKDAFLRDWLIRQEAQMSKLRTEANLWKGLYLAALGRIYDGISEDAAKGQFLAEHLSSPEEVVKLWALKKVEQWRIGTRAKFPAKVGPVLISLVSDQNRDVRLKTANLLSLMGQLDSAEKLLEQLKVEPDDEVRMELFVALGGACHYAFSPNPEFRIPEEIRKQTLEWAEKYLAEQDLKKAQKGAEVIKKLLEQDGLTPGEVDKYLGLLAERYEQEKDSADGALRGELLNAMASLCAQSVYKAESAKRFAPLFEEAVRDETDLVREAAVDGLVYIDKTKALKRLRKDFVNDSSVIVRKKLIDLASEVGGSEDLVWLAEKIGTTAENEPAWQAMLKIFNHSEFGVLNEWISKFNSQSTQARLSDEQRLSFLEIAERKAIGENKAEILKGIREKLARLYNKSGDFERAAEYFGKLREVAQTAEEKERILADLLDVYLRWPKVGLAIQLVDNCLLEKDLEPNNVIVRSINNYLSEPPAGTDPNAILERLSKRLPQARPMWQEQLKRWAERFGRAEEPDEPKEANS